MRAGQVQMIAQEMDEKGPVLDRSRDCLAVYRQLDCRHARYLPMPFLIVLIRSRRARLCNREFGRGSHGKVIIANSGRALTPGLKRDCMLWLRCPLFASNGA